jgi:lysophospholipase L1-like esterase
MAPQITCPADVAIDHVDAATRTVTFDPPSVTGGAQPVQITCSPESGASFALGTTAVNCTASDASSRTAMCTFHVTLKGFSIDVTKYEAFGDSLTAGETGRPGIVAEFDDTEHAYPTRLEAALQSTYPDQGVVVINRGHNGDKVEVTEDIIRHDVPKDKPDAVLLLSGYNNLTIHCKGGKAGTPECNDAIADVGHGVRDCIRRVKEANAGVKFTFVSTLTPPGPSGSNRIDEGVIRATNVEIHEAVAREGATLVDSYSAFLGHEGDYVGPDGLHLSQAGYQALADAFFAAIQKKVPQKPLFQAVLAR